MILRGNFVVSQDLAGQFDVFLEDPQDETNVLQRILTVRFEWSPDLTNVDLKTSKSLKEIAPEDADLKVCLRFSL